MLSGEIVRSVLFLDDPVFGSNLLGPESVALMVQ